MMRVVLALAVTAGLGALAAGVALLVVLRRMMATPASDPVRFVAERQRRHGATVVACVGASTVHGTVSHDFVARLAARLEPDGFQFVNAGRNGDLAYNANRRVHEVVACEPDAVVVLVGTNDVRLAGHSPDTSVELMLKRVPVVPTLEFYRKSLDALVAALRRGTRARIALCSLPPLGEALGSPADVRTAEYCAVIKQVALAHDATYLPVYEQMVRHVRGARGTAGRPYVPGVWPMLDAAAKRYLFGRSWDDIAASHGYVLLTEGVHLNSRGGAMVADQVEHFLRQGS